MKSLLVDALRQANEREASGTLSDSGSFDATRDDFGVIANDEERSEKTRVGVDRSEDVDLELLETSAPADTDPASNDAVEFMAEEPVAMEPDRRIGMKSNATTVEEAPLLAKYSPLLCLCLALAAVGMWSVYLNISADQSATAIGAVFSESRRSESAVETGQGSTEERFPFLSSTEPSRVVEVSE